MAFNDEGTLVGAISFWPVMIEETPGLLLGPLAVHPDMQGHWRRASALMRASLQVD
jgi:predicted N-acetyltransferase YhbS